MSTLRKIFVFLLWTPVIAVGGFLVFTIPPVLSLRWADPVRTAFMWRQPGPVAQTWVPLVRISPALQSSVVSAEDANFYDHFGVDFREMRASWKKNQRKKKYARGFSTIPMQLAKNLYLVSYKNMIRKALEIGIAFEMEALLSKERILELYLNLVEWGPGVYGAEAAARRYFKKPAEALGSNEASFLAAILPNPKRWGRWPPGPYVSARMNALQVRSGLARAKNLPPIPDLPENGNETEGDREEEAAPPAERGEPIPQDL